MTSDSRIHDVLRHAVDGHDLREELALQQVKAAQPTDWADFTVVALEDDLAARRRRHGRAQRIVVAVAGVRARGRRGGAPDRAAEPAASFSAAYGGRAGHDRLPEHRESTDRPSTGADVDRDGLDDDPTGGCQAREPGAAGARVRYPPGRPPSVALGSRRTRDRLPKRQPTPPATSSHSRSSPQPETSRRHSRGTGQPRSPPLAGRTPEVSSSEIATTSSYASRSSTTSSNTSTRNSRHWRPRPTRTCRNTTPAASIPQHVRSRHSRSRSTQHHRSSISRSSVSRS